MVCNRHCRRRKWLSSSAKRPIQQNGSSMNLRYCESPGVPSRIATLSANQAPTAIIGCPHMTTSGGARKNPAINALRLARHIVRSEPTARVLVVNLELCTLHFQETTDLAQLLCL